jgi:hypothetical protein
MVRLLTASFVLTAAVAFASPTYPADVQTHLSLAAPPPQSCSLCHVNGVGAVGTVNTPFGKAMRAQGLVLENPTSLNTALDALAAAKTDSDADGMSDIDELKAGRDPNVAENADGGMGGGGGTTPGALTYGCGSNEVPLLATGLSVLVLLRRRVRS